ncbi:MAG: hypothetical protein WAL91_04945, partial [Propionicimonas sp.]
LRPRLAVLETTYRPGRLEAVAYSGGVEVGRSGLTTAEGPARLVATADRSTISASPSDLAFVSVELRDDEGRLVTGADRAVRVAVSGAGTLAGLCSGNPKTAERFAADTWRTFDGRLLAVVRPSGPGVITVDVTADDLASVSLAIVATRE